MHTPLSSPLSEQERVHELSRLAAMRYVPAVFAQGIPLMLILVCIGRPHDYLGRRCFARLDALHRGAAPGGALVSDWFHHTGSQLERAASAAQRHTDKPG